MVSLPCLCGAEAGLVWRLAPPGGTASSALAVRHQLPPARAAVWAARAPGGASLSSLRAAPLAVLCFLCPYIRPPMGPATVRFAMSSIWDMRLSSCSPMRYIIVQNIDCPECSQRGLQRPPSPASCCVAAGAFLAKLNLRLMSFAHVVCSKPNRIFCDE